MGFRPAQFGLTVTFGGQVDVSPRAEAEIVFGEGGAV
jgi:hypothetical protein